MYRVFSTFFHLETTHPNPNLECGDGCGSSESTGDPTGDNTPSTWGGRGRGRCDLLGPDGENFQHPNWRENQDATMAIKVEMVICHPKWWLPNEIYMHEIVFDSSPLSWDANPITDLLQFLGWIKKTHALFQTFSAIWPIWLSPKIHGVPLESTLGPRHLDRGCTNITSRFTHGHPLNLLH